MGRGALIKSRRSPSAAKDAVFLRRYGRPEGRPLPEQNLSRVCLEFLARRRFSVPTAASTAAGCATGDGAAAGMQNGDQRFVQAVGCRWPLLLGIVNGVLPQRADQMHQLTADFDRVLGDKDLQLLRNPGQPKAGLPVRINCCCPRCETSLRLRAWLPSPLHCAEAHPVGEVATVVCGP